MKTLVLDAMGVIFAAGDDVAELLIPFVKEHGGSCDDDHIAALYLDASLGRISAAEFWGDVGVDPALEDSYLRRHSLSEGCLEFLAGIRPNVNSVWCLSNDLSEWSGNLRRRFGLNRYLQGAVISGNVGIRKPDPAIYDYLLAQVDATPREIVFVDDRVKNLDTAAGLGFTTVSFGATHTSSQSRHRAVANFTELTYLLATMDQDARRCTPCQ